MGIPYRMKSTPLRRRKSTNPRKIATRTVETMTTFVEEMTASREGQTTFFSSWRDSLKYLINFFIKAPWKNRKIGKQAGQEGFEPSTSGFGDQRSTSWSYWPICFPIGISYLIFVSRCKVCLRSKEQYLLNSSLPWML